MLVHLTASRVLVKHLIMSVFFIFMNCLHWQYHAMASELVFCGSYKGAVNQRHFMVYFHEFFFQPLTADICSVKRMGQIHNTMMNSPRGGKLPHWHPRGTWSEHQLLAKAACLTSGSTSERCSNSPACSAFAMG